jgi:sulfate permease, SulP family
MSDQEKTGTGDKKRPGGASPGSAALGSTGPGGARPGRGTGERRAAPRGVARYVPILSWLPSYDRTWLGADAVAGLTLWGLLAPEAMAYAGIAGLPPQAGLYTLLASLFVYALFGTSRHLSVGPTSATAALIASTVAALGVSTLDTELYLSYTIMLVLLVGAGFAVAGLARLGFITQFLSKPVMDGFVTGLAFFVAIGQLNKIFGVEKGTGNSFEKLFHVLGSLPEANWTTFLVGASALALLFLLPRLSRRIPAGLVVLFLYIIVSSLLDLSGRYGVEVVGELPQGFPSFTLPDVPASAVLDLVLPAFGIVLVAYSEAIAVAREFAEKHGYEVDANQELRAQGITNLVSGFLGGMIASGGMSGSAVKEGAGARTQVSNLVAWVAVIVTVLVLTPLFKTLPEAVLAALIIHALWHIIVARKLKQVRLESRVEFLLGVLTFFGVLLTDVLEGMMMGLLASLVWFIYRSTRPHLSSLGRVPGRTDIFSDISRHPENLAVPGMLILRLNGPLFYANAQSTRERMKALLEETDPSPRAVLFDAAAQDELDVTSADILKKLFAELQQQGIDIYLAEVHTPVLEFGRRTGFMDLIADDHVFPTLPLAVAAYEEATRGLGEASS